jgi:hypothetical protein
MGFSHLRGGSENWTVVQYFCTLPASDGTDRACRATVISAADSPASARRSNL